MFVVMQWNSAVTNYKSSQRDRIIDTLAELIFEDCLVPADNCIGGYGEGWSQTMDILNTLMDNTKFDHISKLMEFSKLLDSHLDLPNLYRNIGINI